MTDRAQLVTRNAHVARQGATLVASTACNPETCGLSTLQIPVCQIWELCSIYR